MTGPTLRDMTELTPREQEVLLLLAEGISDREIGERLHIEEVTVKVHTGSLYAKLGVNNRTQAGLLVLHEQLRQAHATTTELRERIAVAQKEIEHVNFFMGRAIEIMSKLGEES